MTEWAILVLAIATMGVVSLLLWLVVIRERLRRARLGPAEYDRFGSLRERQRNLVGPTALTYPTDQALVELMTEIQKVWSVLKQHIEETDPTMIQGVGKVLLPQPMYDDFLTRAAGAQPTPSTRLIYDDWVKMQVPPYEEWMVRIYPKMKLAAELAGELADLPATSPKEEERAQGERAPQKDQLPS